MVDVEPVVSVQDATGTVEGDIRNWDTDHAICRGLHGRSLEMIISILMRFNFISKLLHSHVFHLVVIEESSVVVEFDKVASKHGTRRKSVINYQQIVDTFLQFEGCQMTNSVFIYGFTSLSARYIFEGIPNFSLVKPGRNILQVIKIYFLLESSFIALKFNTNKLTKHRGSKYIQQRYELRIFDAINSEF